MRLAGASEQILARYPERSYATAHTLGYHGHGFGDFHLILPSRP